MKGKISEIAGSDMYNHVISFPEQIESAVNSEISDVQNANKICICGMGASAMAGDIISDFSDGFSKTSITVIRGIELPKWVDKDTTVIMISYSGETKETLEAYKDALKRKCTIICMTSGGTLATLCEKNSNVLVKMPKGLISRGALGYMIGYLGIILEKMGLCEFRNVISEIVGKLKVFRNSLVSDDDNIAMQMAKTLLDKVPVIYSLYNMRSAAMRWKSQINENSKMIAFCGTIPEFNHNEIVGWTEDLVSEKFTPVILYDDNATEMLKYMTDTSLAMLMDRGLEVCLYHVEGVNALEKCLRCILLGDFVSLYLAFLRKADPTENEVIVEIQEQIEEN